MIADTEFIGLAKTSNFTFDKLTVAKSELVKFFLWLSKKLKTDFREFANFLYYKCVIGVITPRGCTGLFSNKDGGIQVLAGLAPSSQIVGSLFPKKSA
jgi:hypothetical protein